ncbi:Acyl-CoA synthetase (AMP-forming)/AMP-acid ligase II [Geodermatophilus amargosae]|uniref:Acyl-CoA synthetase (AMP-forming)/AMP-acid ligase II n=1 Tax=Geodermatophilus amargosae TaxID=1296565 RepID=A0A1I6X7U2_9ACTN|nr:Acyl-CoA synthetase (AMP-forming)/AMP-acid ligase II [Geodermatophilus amargosae]
MLGRLAELAHWIPDAVALEAADGSLTFGELYQRVLALSAELVEAVEALPGTPSVGIWAEQDTTSVAALLAALTTGTPCVELDITLPEARLAEIAQRADIGIVLADDARREAAAALPGVVEVRGLLPTREAPAEPVQRGVTGDTPACLLFTSGTTGAPKGVVYTQRTVLAGSYNSRDALRITPADRVALVFPISFAAGLIVMTMGVLNGATTCIRDPRVHGVADAVDWIQSERVSLLACAPSLLRALSSALADGQVLPHLRIVTTAGEKIFGQDVLDIRPHLGPHASVVNWLGSSETQALSTFEVAADDPVPPGVLPAGRALPLHVFEILGEDGAVLPVGEPGILHITSEHHAAGYWKDKEQTAEKFLPLPDGRVRVRSGDRATLDEDGVLRLLGRADDAVKIRGYLVEPAEVEVALRSLPQVRDVVVRAQPDERGLDRLVAWVVPDPAGGTASPAVLRSGVARRLPAYMVPRDVVLLEELPRNERGKVVAAALPPVPERPTPVPPATPTEAALEPIWGRILHLDHVGRDESFTALGGDSLAVEEMLASVTSHLGVELATADLAERPTLTEFAALVAARSADPSGRRTSNVVRLRTTGTRPPVFCFAGAGGAAAAFSPLAGALGPDQPVYALQVRGLEDRGVPDWTVGQAARRYLRQLEEIAPEGPVVLVGHSLGGLFALAVAHLLRQRGREVVDLVLVDTYLPLRARPDDVPRRQGPEAAPITRAELWRTRLQVLTAGLVRRPAEVQQEVFHQHGARVARFHRPQPWPGRALLVLSTENDDELAWWEPLLTGEHEVLRLEGDHNALLRLPYVVRIAEQVTAAVDGVVQR